MTFFSNLRAQNYTPLLAKSNRKPALSLSEAGRCQVIKFLNFESKLTAHLFDNLWMPQDRSAAILVRRSHNGAHAVNGSNWRRLQTLTK